MATPLAGDLDNIADFRNFVSPLRLGIGIGGWLLAAVLLPLSAQRVLRRLA